MDLDYFKIFVTILLALAGWIAAHRFTSRRDMDNKKRELTADHLIGAYRILTQEIMHRYLDVEKLNRLENVLMDIQLFWSETQIGYALEIIDMITQKKDSDMHPLINSLRHDLRDQLNLSSINGNVTWLRFHEKYL